LAEPPEHDAPPAILGSFAVLAYACVDEDVRYSGTICLYVGGRLLGRVPRLVIAQEADSSEVRILHCDGDWSVLGASPGGPTLALAKERAERGYPGIRCKWTDTPRTPEQVSQLLRESWDGWACSFCGRIPPEVETMVEASAARICNLCVDQFHEWNTEDRIH
jgi:hypothetical protein